VGLQGGAVGRWLRWWLVVVVPWCVLLRILDGGRWGRLGGLQGASGGAGRLLPLPPPLLQRMGEGSETDPPPPAWLSTSRPRVTDSQGRTVSFKNAIIILTSNLGSQEIYAHTIKRDAGQQGQAGDPAQLSEADKQGMRDVVMAKVGGGRGEGGGAGRGEGWQCWWCWWHAMATLLPPALTLCHRHPATPFPSLPPPPPSPAAARPRRCASTSRRSS
jgi:hypothetical protein